MSRARRLDVLLALVLLVPVIPATLSSDQRIGSTTDWDTVLLPLMVVPILVRRTLKSWLGRKNVATLSSRTIWILELPWR